MCLRDTKVLHYLVDPANIPDELLQKTNDALENIDTALLQQRMNEIFITGAATDKENKADWRLERKIQLIRFFWNFCMCFHKFPDQNQNSSATYIPVNSSVAFLHLSLVDCALQIPYVILWGIPDQFVYRPEVKELTRVIALPGKHSLHANLAVTLRNQGNYGGYRCQCLRHGGFQIGTCFRIKVFLNDTLSSITTSLIFKVGYKKPCTSYF